MQSSTSASLSFNQRLMLGSFSSKIEETVVWKDLTATAFFTLLMERQITTSALANSKSAIRRTMGTQGLLLSNLLKRALMEDECTTFFHKKSPPATEPKPYQEWRYKVTETAGSMEKKLLKYIESQEDARAVEEAVEADPAPPQKKRKKNNSIGPLGDRLQKLNTYNNKKKKPVGVQGVQGGGGGVEGEVAQDDLI